MTCGKHCKHELITQFANVLVAMYLLFKDSDSRTNCAPLSRAGNSPVNKSNTLLPGTPASIIKRWPTYFWACCLPSWSVAWWSGLAGSQTGRSRRCRGLLVPRPETPPRQNTMQVHISMKYNWLCISINNEVQPIAWSHLILQRSYE